MFLSELKQLFGYKILYDDENTHDYIFEIPLYNNRIKFNKIDCYRAIDFGRYVVIVRSSYCPSERCDGMKFDFDTFSLGLSFIDNKYKLVYPVMNVRMNEGIAKGVYESCMSLNDTSYAYEHIKLVKSMYKLVLKPNPFFEKFKEYIAPDRYKIIRNIGL